MRSTIYIDIISVDFKKPLKNQNFKENIVGIYLRKSFILGKTICKDIKEFYHVTKAENTTHIYVYMPENNKIQIIEKSSNNTSICDKVLKFSPNFDRRIIFSPQKLRVTEKLIGLEKVKNKLISYLNSDLSRLIYIHGPPENGKRTLLRQLHDESTHLLFLEFNTEKFMRDTNYSIDVAARISDLTRPVVLYVCDADEIMSHVPFDDLLEKMLAKLLEDDSIDIKVVIHTSDMSNIRDRLPCNGVHIYVRNPCDHDKIELLHNLIRDDTGTTPLENGLDELVTCLRGFSVVDVIKFVEDVAFECGHVSVEHLVECGRSIQFVPNHLLELSTMIEPLHWQNIGGYEHVKMQLATLVQAPLQANLLEDVKGILLHGPPGCSKTMFARALATECGLRLFSVTPTSIMASLVGESEARLRHIFDQALASSPSMIFMDEIDMILPARNHHAHSSNVTNRLINELLTFLNGVNTSHDQMVLFVAATNRIDNVDEALIRPGRIDLQIKIGLPDQDARLSILQIVFSDNNFSVTSDVLDNMAALATLLEGRSGAEIVELVRLIKKLAERRYDADGTMHYIDNPTIEMGHVSTILSDNDYRTLSP